MMRRAANTRPAGQASVQPPSLPVAKAHRSPLQKAYTIALALMALLAAGYLTVLVANPDILTAWMPATSSTTASSETVFDSEAEISALRTSVTQLQTDVARTRSDVGVLARNDKALESSIGAIESKMDGLSEALRQQAVAALQSGAGEGVTQGASAPAESAKVINTPARVAEAELPPPAPVKPAAKAKPSVTDDEPATTAAKTAKPAATPAQLETGSLGPAPAPAKPAKPFGLKIISAPSVDELRLYWSLMSGQHGSDLSGLDPRYVAGADQQFNLVAGPITSKADARRKCKQLAEKGVTCSVTEFGGNSL